MKKIDNSEITLRGKKREKKAHGGSYKDFRCCFSVIADLMESKTDEEVAARLFHLDLISQTKLSLFYPHLVDDIHRNALNETKEMLDLDLKDLLQSPDGKKAIELACQMLDQAIEFKTSCRAGLQKSTISEP